VPVQNHVIALSRVKASELVWPIQCKHTGFRRSPEANIICFEAGVPQVITVGATMMETASKDFCIVFNINFKVHEVPAMIGC